MSWRAASLRTGLDLERLYDRPSGYATWTAFYVMSYACADGRCHTARRSPRVHPTSTSRDVSDQAFHSLSNFYCMSRCACGEGLGTRLQHIYFIIWCTGHYMQCMYVYVCLYLYTCTYIYICLYLYILVDTGSSGTVHPLTAPQTPLPPSSKTVCTMYLHSKLHVYTFLITNCLL